MRFQREKNHRSYSREPCSQREDRERNRKKQGIQIAPEKHFHKTRGKLEQMIIDRFYRQGSKKAEGLEDHSMFHRIFHIFLIHLFMGSLALSTVWLLWTLGYIAFTNHYFLYPLE